MLPSLRRVGHVGLDDRRRRPAPTARSTLWRHAVDALAEAGPHVADGRRARAPGRRCRSGSETSSARWSAKRSGSIESMSANRFCVRHARPSACASMIRSSDDRSRGGASMPNPGTIHGTHHLTFCVGGAQEDYDFHVRTLGLKSVKKTVLFDGEIPIYHLYYGNGVGRREHDPHGVPVPPGGLDGQARAPTRRSRSTCRCPRTSLGYWADRLARRRASRSPRSSASAPSGSSSRTRAASRTTIVGETREDDREPYDGGDVPAEHAIRGAYGTTTSVREPEPMDYFLREALNAEHDRLRGRAPPVRLDRRRARAASSSSSRSPTCRRARGTSARARSTTTRSTSARPRTSCA